MEFPLIGLGTAQNKSQESVTAVIKEALAQGYKLIDTAQMYDNESQIGQALTDLKVDRTAIGLTSKVVPENMNRVSDSVHESLRNLNTDYFDLFLIHGPSDRKTNAEAYKELMKFREAGVFKNIGVSNFSVKQLQELHEDVKEGPFNNQISAGPTFFHPDVEEFCKEHKITLTGYSIMKPYFSPNTGQKNSAMSKDQKEYIDELANKYNKNPGQILNRGALQHGYHVIPKTSNPSRLAGNIDILDFELTNKEIKHINLMNTIKVND